MNKFGIEARDGTYAIAKDRLYEATGDHGWEEHMAEKRDWVDMNDFLAALSWAREFFSAESRKSPRKRPTPAVPSPAVDRTARVAEFLE